MPRAAPAAGAARSRASGERTSAMIFTDLAPYAWRMRCGTERGVDLSGRDSDESAFSEKALPLTTASIRDARAMHPGALSFASPATHNRRGVGV